MARDEVPSRKGYPSYSTATWHPSYERAGVLRRRPGKRYPDTHTHHAKRRYNTPHSRPHGLYNRGADRSFRGTWRQGAFTPGGDTAQPLEAHERRNREGLYEGRPPQSGRATVCLIQQGERSAVPGRGGGRDELSPADRASLAFGRAFNIPF